LANGYKSAGMISKRLSRTLLVLVAAASLALPAGCGSDSSGESTTDTSVSIPTPTSPIPTTSTPSTTTGGGKQGKGQTTTTAGGGSAGACSIPDAYQNFKYTGLDCTAAVAVATAWDADGKDCNTVDNPNVDEGYNRTCTVEAFTCTAKRDVHSDARFVACTQGGQTIRFTWLPA
jgi:hypothetical protein